MESAFGEAARSIPSGDGLGPEETYGQRGGAFAPGAGDGRERRREAPWPQVGRDTFGRSSERQPPVPDGPPRRGGTGVRRPNATPHPDLPVVEEGQPQIPAYLKAAANHGPRTEGKRRISSRHRFAPMFGERKRLRPACDCRPGKEVDCLAGAAAILLVGRSREIGNSAPPGMTCVPRKSRLFRRRSERYPILRNRLFTS